MFVSTVTLEKREIEIVSLLNGIPDKVFYRVNYF